MDGNFLKGNFWGKEVLVKLMSWIFVEDGLGGVDIFWKVVKGEEFDGMLRVIK